MNVTPLLDERRNSIIPAFATLSVWRQISGIGRSLTYELLGAGQLRARKVGTRTLIDVSHGLAWLDAQPIAIVRPHGAYHRTKSVA